MEYSRSVTVFHYPDNTKVKMFTFYLRVSLILWKDSSVSIHNVRLESRCIVQRFQTREVVTPTSYTESGKPDVIVC